MDNSAEAGFFSNVWKLLSGSGGSDATNSSLAAISMPLLKGSSAPSFPAVGGPDPDPETSLSVTQDSAIVAVRNPAGTLPAPSTDQILVYTVENGDTPSSIAERFGISLNTLLWANNLKGQNLIKVGDNLVILPVSGVQYDIKKGDTIESIAKKFKGDPADIMSFNGLAINEPLQAGNTIIIPDGEVATPLKTSTASLPSSSASRFANLPDLRGYFMRPISGGVKTRGIHGYNGVDLANSCGLPVFASADGQVIVASTGGWHGGYGNYIVISHGNGVQTLYAHLSEIIADAGQSVSQGMVIGLIGSTGNSTGCHMHFEVRGAQNPF